MSDRAVDVTGYEIGRARAMLDGADVAVADVRRIGPTEDSCEGDREIVIRQRVAGASSVELTVSGVWVAPEKRGE
jgi:hypothetical protein